MSDLSNAKPDQPLLDEPSTPRCVADRNSTNKTVIRKLTCVFVLSFTFMIVEIIGGILSNSLAILADAGHLFSDLLGFLISIISVWISALPADSRHSYGYHRAGVIGALASVMIIWALMGFLVYYAVQRMINIDKIELDGPIMFVTACFGLLTNVLMIKVLNWESELTEEEPKDSKSDSRRGSKIDDINLYMTKVKSIIHEVPEGEEVEDLPCQNELYSPPKAQEFTDEEINLKIKLKSVAQEDLEQSRETEENKEDKAKKVSVNDNFNIRATVIHIIGDMIQSIGVIFGAALVWISPQKLKIADPIITFIFSIIMMAVTIRIVKDCILVLMEATPTRVDIEEFKTKIKGVPGVLGIHDFHVWALSEDKPAMSAHIYTDADPQIILKKVTKVCRLYEIFHSTIQVETVADNKHAHYVNCGHDVH